MSEMSSTKDDEIRSLKHKIGILENRIQTLEDIEEIHKLQRIYGYYLDSNRWDDAIDLLADDCSVEINGRGVYLGKKGAETFFKKILQGDQPEGGEGFLGNHLMVQGVVHVDPDGQTAKGRYQLLIQLGVYGEMARWMGGVYENEYVKENGKWKFKKLHWYTRFSTPYEDGWGKTALPLLEPSDEFPPDLPPSVDYKSYPSFFIAPFHFKNPVSGK